MSEQPCDGANGASHLAVNGVGVGRSRVSAAKRTEVGQVVSQSDEDVTWTTYARAYDEVVGLFGEYRALVDVVVTWLPRCDRCIDIGAGTGNASLRLLEEGRVERILAVERDTAMIARFREKLAALGAGPSGRIGLVRCDALDLGCLPDGRFDSAVLVNVLHAVEDSRRCLREASRVLRPGATMVLSTSHRDTDVESLLEAIRSSLIVSGHYQRLEDVFKIIVECNRAWAGHFTRDSVDDILRLVEGNGFRIEEGPVPAYAGSVVVISAVKDRS